MERITLEEMKEGIKKAVEMRGEDYVNKVCKYHNPETGEPQCIVGVALSIIRPEIFRDIEEGTASRVLKPFATELAVCYAAYAQCAQDYGSTWGQSLAAAEQAITK